MGVKSHSIALGPQEQAELNLSSPRQKRLPSSSQLRKGANDDGC